MTSIVMDRIRRYLRQIICAKGTAGVRVWIEARVVRTGDVNRNSMTLVKDQARRPQIDLKLIDLALLHEYFTIESFPEAGPQR